MFFSNLFGLAAVRGAMPRIVYYIATLMVLFLPLHIKRTNQKIDIMQEIKFPTDRTIDSTDTNEYADGQRDENFWEEDIVDTEIANSDIIPSAVDELGQTPRPEYEEDGFRENIGE